MSVLYELKDKSVCPPGGFVFVKPDGSRYEGCYSVSTVEQCAHQHRITVDEAWQKVLHETYCNIAPTSRDYFISKNTEALIIQNPTFRYVDKSKLLPCPYAYNPGLITIDDEDWLVYRRQMANSDSDVCRYSFKTEKNFPIKLPSTHPGEQFEDPRVFWHDNAIHILICSWRKTWAYKPLLRLFKLKKDWSVDEEIPLHFGGNGKGVTQKNWMHFEHERKLHFIYHYSPFQVVEGNHLFTGKRLEWNYGEIRGGTPPIRVGDHYLTFFHSRTDVGRAKYHMGAMIFEAKAPFTPTAMTMNPLMSATNREPGNSWSPLTVFPCGAIIKEDVFTVSIGVNDLACGLVDYQVEELLALMEKI